VIEGGIALITFIALAMNLLVDILYTIINPRISYD
jgi:ABC-type dipeptide/oligopeptide/nickel transport system permease component